MSSKKSPKAVATLVGDEQQLSRRIVERWTLREAAAELSEQCHGVMSPADWLAVLEKLVPAELVHPPGGEVQADELNALLDAHPRWKAVATPRLPSAKNSYEHAAGYWDASMHAADWFDMAALTSREAASLLCQSDPLDKSADPETVTNLETGPVDFNLLLRVFLDVERSNPGCRTLLEWLKFAKARGCKHHAWIDQYLDARAQLGFPIVEASGGAISDASGNKDGVSDSPWWMLRYDIYEMATNIGATLHSQHKKVSNAAIAKEIATRISGEERRTGRNGAAPSWDTIRGKFTGMRFNPG